MTKPNPDFPWHVPITIHEIPETGRRFALAPSAAERAAVAAAAGLDELPRLEAAFDVARDGQDGLHVVGRVSATVGQTCVVTLEPIENEVEEAIDLVFSPAIAAGAGAMEHSAQVGDADEGPEPLVGGTIDLGEIATEFLILAIDPYPRKSGVVFEAPSAGEDSTHPFAALAALKKGQGRNGR
jgi:uncharacterized metal-binding protein YceD (DUF177 family)